MGRISTDGEKFFAPTHLRVKTLKLFAFFLRHLRIHLYTSAFICVHLRIRLFAHQPHGKNTVMTSLMGQQLQIGMGHSKPG